MSEGSDYFDVAQEFAGQDYYCPSRFYEVLPYHACSRWILVSI